jgi:hypothetical protein
LVHELAHLAGGSTQTISVHNEGAKHPYSKLRSGFVVGADRKPFVRGTFYEEGFATFMSGWYKRTLENPLAPAVPAPGESPSLQTPDYYRFRKNSISGPDGYAIELLARGLQTRKIMSATEYVAVMLESRRPETRTAALRIFAQAIEAVRPGLYTDLQNLQYGRKPLKRALKLVLEATNQ